jgi:hypothetical protein
MGLNRSRLVATFSPDLQIGRLFPFLQARCRKDESFNRPGNTLVHRQLIMRGFAFKDAQEGTPQGACVLSIWVEKMKLVR